MPLGRGSSFEPTLICFSNGSTIRLSFFCDCQTLNQLQGLRDLSPQALSRKHPSVYRSAIVHHGSIGRAFKEIGIDYPFEEISDWKSKVGPFFGKLPDTVIAECVNVSVNTIRMLRKKLGIERYLKRRIFEEVI